MFLLKAVLTVAAKIAGASTVAQVTAGVGLTVAGMTGAGAAGVLPTPIQDGVAHAVEAVTPFTLPGSSAATEPAHQESEAVEPAEPTRATPAVETDSRSEADDDVAPTPAAAPDPAAEKTAERAARAAEKAQRSADKAAEKAQKSAEKAAEKAARTHADDAAEAAREAAEHTATSSSGSREQESGDDDPGSSGSGSSGSGGHHGGDD